MRARSERDPDALKAAVKRQTRALHDVQELLGEAAPDAASCETAYRVARELPDVEVIPELADQLGRVGRGLGRVEHEERIELIFTIRDPHARVAEALACFRPDLTIAFVAKSRPV